MGRKVFLQGGVALNRAVAHAFAHSVGRQIVIPRSPELLGALGVALLALQRSGAWPATSAAGSANSDASGFSNIFPMRYPAAPGGTLRGRRRTCWR